MANPLSYAVYKVVRGLARVFFRRPEYIGTENLPEDPCVLVGNHAQMHGPVLSEVYLPGPHAVWCNAEMMDIRQVPDYAYRDFWSKKPARVRWLYRIASYLIAPVSACVFGNALCIPVYHDMRIVNTFRQSLSCLEEGKRIVIFPEQAVPHNHIVYDFQDRFIDLGRMYRGRAGRELPFVPMYVCPALGRVIFGRPVYCEPAASPEQARVRVKDALMEAITALADAQPRHRVVPYPNLPKREYPYNHPGKEETS